MTAPMTVASQIFGGDPNRPGAGYVDVAGKSYRIEGVSGGAPGYYTEGGQYIPGAGATYILDSGGGQTITGPEVNISDYLSWLNAPHAQNTAAGSAMGPAPTGFTSTGASHDDVNAITLPDSTTDSGSSSSGSTTPKFRTIAGLAPNDTNPATQEPIPVAQTDPSVITIPGIQSPTDTGGVTGGGTSGTSGMTGATTPTTGGSPSGGTSTDNRLLDLLAAMYAGAGGGGNPADSSFGGLLTAPVNSATGADGGAVAGPSGLSTGAKLALLAVLVIGGIWWYRHHKKKGEAK